jgi:hypothetical protein
MLLDQQGVVDDIHSDDDPTSTEQDAQDVPLSEAEMNNDEELREQHGLFIST